MADNDDLKRYPVKPLETDTEWQRLHRSMYFSEEMWRVVGPIVAIVRNWKAWAIAAGVFIFFRRPEVIAVLDLISGTTK